MREILSSTELRRLSMIELLTEHQDFMSFKEISETLGVSIRTIQADIDLMSEFSFFFRIKVHNQQIKLSYAHHQNIQKVYSYLLTHSSGYKIIAEILKHGSVNLEHLINILDLSRSSIYRLCNKIDKALKAHFNIELAQNPFTFVGDEVDIRYFLSHFIAEKYTDTPVHLCPQVNFYLLDEMIVTISKALVFPIDFAKLNGIRLLTIIQIIRTQQGYYIYQLDVNNEAVERILDEESVIHHLLTQFMTSIQLPFEPFYIMNIFSGFLLNHSYFSELALGQALENNSDLRNIIDSLDHSISQLALAYKLTIPQKNELIYHLYQATQLNKFEVGSSYILYNTKGIFINKIMQLYPRFIEGSQQAMEALLVKNLKQYQPELLIHLTYTLLTHWESLSIQLFEHHQKVKTLVLSSLDIHHAHFLKDHMSWKLGNLVDIEVYNNIHFNNLDLADQLKDNDCKLIIANCPLPDIPNKATISIHSVPTVDDLNQILTIVKEIQRSHLNT